MIFGLLRQSKRVLQRLEGLDDCYGVAVKLFSEPKLSGQ